LQVPALPSFAADWVGADIRRLHALAATLTGQTADVIADLAVKLATIEQALEEQAYVASRYGIMIGVDGMPPPEPGAAAGASERHWARAYRQAHDQAMADARQARDRAAARLRELRAFVVITASLPARATLSPGRTALRIEGVRPGERRAGPGRR
jgi:hypothetical protein